MCRRVVCKKCGKPSWVGCGAHIESVLGDVPADQRCKCKAAAAQASASKADQRPWWRFWA